MLHIMEALNPVELSCVNLTWHAGHVASEVLQACLHAHKCHDRDVPKRQHAAFEAHEVTGFSPKGFHKGRGFNVANSATQLYHAYIWAALLAINRHLGNILNPVLNGICDVWHNLYSLAQVVTSALTLYDMLQSSATVSTLRVQCDCLCLHA